MQTKSYPVRYDRTVQVPVTRYPGTIGIWRSNGPDAWRFGYGLPMLCLSRNDCIDLWMEYGESHVGGGGKQETVLGMGSKATRVVFVHGSTKFGEAD